MLGAQQPCAEHDNGEFDPGFFAEYQCKDLQITTDAGEEFGAPMSQTELAHEPYRSMVQNGMGQDCNSGIMQVIEMVAGEEAGEDWMTGHEGQ